MAMGLNRVEIIGYLGKDAETRQFSSSKKMSFSVAVSESYKRRDGTKQETTTWFNVACWHEGTINGISGYLTKGTRVFVQGKFQVNSYTDKNGVDRQSMEVITGPGGIILLGASKGQASSGPPATGNSTSNTGDGDPLDDEIPF